MTSEWRPNEVGQKEPKHALELLLALPLAAAALVVAYGAFLLAMDGLHWLTSLLR